MSFAPFIDRNCGDGTLYATPTEFMRDILREKKQRIEAAELHTGILEGYQDAIAGKILRDGNLVSPILLFLFSVDQKEGPSA